MGDDNLKKYDFILIGLILVSALIWGGLQYFVWGKDGTYVVVTQNGQRIGKYSLAEDMELLITDDKEGINTLVIENGKVNVSDADCPDKLCMRQKAISKNGESIICLPHHLAIEIVGDGDKELDALVR